MEKLGISSACFYPLTTEESFLKLCKADIKCAEIFFNSPSELSDRFINELSAMKKHYEVYVPSIHPFMSFAESFFLFSSYERRFYDILDLYKRFFEIMNKLDSKYFIIHGAKIPGSVDDNVYCERFSKLIELGLEYNINVLQENVVNYRSQSVEYLEMMKKSIGDKFGITLDIKQAKRADVDPFEIIKKLGTSIKHIHISDYNDSSSCIPPLEGKFDFIRFFDEIKTVKFNGSFIIELYNHSYADEKQIFDSYDKINEILVDY